MLLTERYTLASITSTILATKGLLSKDCTCCLATDEKYTYLVLSNKVYYIYKDWSHLDKLTYEKVGDFSADIEYELPFFDGQQFGEAEELESALLRDGILYRRVVQKENSFHSKINDKIEKLAMYKMIESDRTGHKETLVAPYTGIVSQTYEHNGTLDKYEEILVETNLR